MGFTIFEGGVEICDAASRPFPCFTICPTAENSDSRTTTILDSGHSSGTISSIIPVRSLRPVN